LDVDLTFDVLFLHLQTVCKTFLAICSHQDLAWARDTKGSSCLLCAHKVIPMAIFANAAAPQAGEVAV